MLIRNKLAIAAAVAAALTAWACKSGADDADVSSIEFNQSIKSAAATFKISDSEMTAFLTQSASAQWPEKMGDYDLTVLQDSLLRYMFDITDGKRSVNAAIKAGVTEVDSLLIGADTRIERVTEVPAGSGGPEAWVYDVAAKLMEFNDRTITYQVVTYSYLGGAHPNTSIKPFTYDFTTSTVYTNANLFKPGTEKAILEAVTAALARQEGMNQAQLEEAGYTLPLPGLGDPYVSDGMLVFHYDPYAVAPYAMGDIDIEVNPADLREYMTPQAAALFDIAKP